MAPASRRHADDSPPIGRDAEATRLARLVDDTAAGAKRAALLLGVPGIGKTTLLRYVRGRAEHRGLLCTYTRVPATAGLPPRFPLGQLLEGFVAACEARDAHPPDRLRRVVATLTGATSIDEYEVSFPQIADALEETGAIGPLGIFVDDYDWAPAEGTELLMAALRVVETPICFVASARLRAPGEEPPSALPTPSADLWIDAIEVRGLDPSAVTALATSVLGGGILPSLADALFARTLGNPLFIDETLQSWRQREALVETGGYWGISEGGEPLDAGSLRDMIAMRLAKLPSETLTVAGTLAVIGREARFEEIAAASGIADADLVERLRALDAEGLLGESDGSPRYRLAHPLHVSSVIDALGATRVAELHDGVAAHLRRRAEHGERVSASERAHHAVRSLHPPLDLRALLTAAALEARSAGSQEEAGVWYGHLAEISDDPRDLVAALEGQAVASIPTDPARGVQLATYALELESDPNVRARLLLTRARAHRVAGMPGPAMTDLEDALPQAHPTESFDIRHAIAVLHGMAGRIDEAEAVFRSLAAEYRASPERWKAVGHLGLVALLRGDLVEGARLQEEAFRAAADPQYVRYLRSNIAWIMFVLGRWDDAAGLLREGLGDAVASGNIEEESILSCISARLAAMRGDLAASFDAGQRAIRLADRIGNPADMITAQDAMALALMENDMPHEAAAILPTVVSLDTPGIEPREYSYTYSVLGEAAIRAGDLDRARTAIRHGREHLSQASLWEVALDRVDAHIELALGNALGAIDALKRWLAEPTPILIEHARLNEVAADASWAIGDRAGATTRAQEALRVYEQLGAARRARRMSGWLIDRTAKRAGRPRSALPGNLTPRETEILRLIVLGRSNKDLAAELFISVGTVKKHIENITAKAGVSRRTELVPFAIGIGVLAVEDLRPERLRATRRVVRLDQIEASEPAPAD